VRRRSEGDRRGFLEVFGFAGVCVGPCIVSWLGIEVVRSLRYIAILVPPAGSRWSFRPKGISQLIDFRYSDEE
jgi:hypothetical protein